ncbi:MAG: hypothetical protein NVSMB64_32510 [Candidatus Velthaea sp.]
MNIAPVQPAVIGPGLEPLPGAAITLETPGTRSADFVLQGGSGLIVQSYGAIALISAAALAQLASARESSAIFAVPAVLPVTRIAAIRRIDIFA